MIVVNFVQHSNYERQTDKQQSMRKKKKLVSGNKTNSCYKLHAPTDTHTLTHTHSFADTHTHTYICIVSRQSCVLKEKRQKQNYK